MFFYIYVEKEGCEKLYSRSMNYTTVIQFKHTIIKFLFLVAQVVE